MNELQASYRWCRYIARSKAKNFYYAFITLPPKKRLAIYASYAFCRLCDDAVDEPATASNKLELLDGLRHQLLDAYSGNPSGPVFTALVHAASSFHIPEELFQEIITGVETDLTKRRYRNFEELRTYCYRVASVVGLICTEIFGYSAPSARQYAVDLGLAMQLTNIIRDIREDLHRDRIYIPQEDMAHFGYSEESLISEVMDSSFVDMMRFEAGRARRYFNAGQNLIPLLPLRARPCAAVLARFYLRILDRMEASNFNIFNGKMTLSRREKLFLTAQTCMTSILPFQRPSSS